MQEEGRNSQPMHYVHQTIAPMQAIYVGGNSLGDFPKTWVSRLIELVSKVFPSFTLLDAIGVFRGRREHSLVVQIATNDLSGIKNLAEMLRREFEQEGVGVLLQDGSGPAVYGRVAMDANR